MGKEMEGHEPVKDYHELTILIETGLEALSAARDLLAGLENLPEVMAAPRLAALLGHQSSATLPRIREVVERDRRRLAIIERLVTLLPKAGRNGASILYKMLDNPGVLFRVRNWFGLRVSGPPIPRLLKCMCVTCVMVCVYLVS